MIYHSILETPEIALRAIEPEDIELLYRWENNSEVWIISSTIAPFSRDILKKYIENSHLDIYSIKQLRLMIDCKKTKNTIGAIDLYNFDPHNRRTGVGIFVEPQFSAQGYGEKSLRCVLEYCKDVLFLDQVYSEITSINTPSLELFKKVGFETNGMKKSWIKTPDGYIDEFILQYIF
ncbi:MAG TPA: GNAT family N-acetyltransferase [Bacteroidales bacterium]|nr:GNAT family N-acetyltransferase [Bacteroidales bacterium]